ncbi:MFS transporter [Echinicola salinicaeni]|uniref:MFS transporter n=1 Tax=Echinicola salinicaeni TaxID=2762757 RepID=UPI001647AC90|nr:MFS transporter [Echinicola salinicaeni]
MLTSQLSKISPVLFTFIIMGFVDVVGVSTGFVKQDFGLSDTLAQFLPSMVFIWFFVFSIPFGVWQDKIGKKNMMSLGILVTFVGLLVPFVLYSYFSIVIAFILLGIGNTIIQVAANPLLQEVSSSQRLPSYLSFAQFIKSITALFGPIIATGMAMYFGDWKLVFLVYAVGAYLSLIWLRNTEIIESKSDSVVATFSSCFDLLSSPFIMLVVLAIFLIVGADVGMYSNIQVFLIKLHQVSLENASYGISVYFTAQMIGRLSGAVLLSFIKTYSFLILATLFSALGVIVLYFSSTVFMAYLSIFFIGLGAANLFPLVFSIAINALPERSNEISGLLVMAIVGGAVVPPFIGFVTAIWTVSVSILALLGVFVGILVASLFLLKIKKIRFIK